MGRRVEEETKLEGKITVTRPQGRDEDIRIYVEDETSGVQFLEVRIGLEDFARMLTGLASNPCTLLVQGFSVVGKTREYERAEVFISEKEYNELHYGVTYDHGRERLAEWLVKNHSREGWTVDTYLGSQGSITYVEGGKNLRFGYSRYV